MLSIYAKCKILHCIEFILSMETLTTSPLTKSMKKKDVTEKTMTANVIEKASKEKTKAKVNTKAPKKNKVSDINQTHDCNKLKKKHSFKKNDTLNIISTHNCMKKTCSPKRRKQIPNTSTGFLKTDTKSQIKAFSKGKPCDNKDFYRLILNNLENVNMMLELFLLAFTSTKEKLDV